MKALLSGFLLVLTSMSAPLSFAAEEKILDKAAAAVLELLQQKDFWTNAGKLNGRKWSPEEETQLHKVWAATRDPAVRLRANKVLVDLANQGKSDGDEDFVAANFEQLEAKLAEPGVKLLCAETGFTHYFSNRGQQGVFLIEHVNSNTSTNGGLNLYWDAKLKNTGEAKIMGLCQNRGTKLIAAGLNSETKRN